MANAANRKNNAWDNLYASLFLRIIPWYFVGYLALGLGFFRCLVVDGTTSHDAFYLTWAILTGSDPFGLQKEIGTSGATWWIAWCLHTLGWFVFPIVVGILVVNLTERFKDIAKGIAKDIAKDMEHQIERLLNISGLYDADLRKEAKEEIREEINKFGQQKDNH